MRIIAGTAKGRRIEAPPGRATRPATGRMRESVFSSIGLSIEGARVLDLYAGSGSFGLEALSRGARSAVFVERDRAALERLRKNVESVGLGGRVVAADVATAVSRLTGAFDVVFVDPPYSAPDHEVNSLLEAVSGRVSEGGMVVVHRRRDHEEPRTDGTLTLTDERSFGDAVVRRYQKEAP